MDLEKVKNELLDEVGDHIENVHIEDSKIHVRISDGGDGFIVSNAVKGYPGIGKALDHPDFEPGEYYVFEEY